MRANLRFMNKRLFVLSLSLLTLFACEQNQLPENPKDNEEYVDNSGNHWLWNAMLMRWMITSPMGVTHYYYPQSNVWQNSNGMKTTPPVNLKETVQKTKSSSSGVWGKSKSVFGKTGKSYSIRS